MNGALLITLLRCCRVHIEYAAAPYWVIISETKVFDFESECVTFCSTGWGYFISKFKVGKISAILCLDWQKILNSACPFLRTNTVLTYSAYPIIHFSFATCLRRFKLCDNKTTFRFLTLRRHIWWWVVVKRGRVKLTFEIYGFVLLKDANLCFIRRVALCSSSFVMVM